MIVISIVQFIVTIILFFIVVAIIMSENPTGRVNK